MNRTVWQARWVAPLVSGFSGLLGCGGQDMTELGYDPAQIPASMRADAPLELGVERAAVAGAESQTPPVPVLAWAPCAAGFECADALVPLDYADVRGATLRVAVTRLPARDPARRIGVLFFNFGGPGGDAVGTLHAIGANAFGVLNERFDLVGFDPRGTGATEGAIDCRLNQQTEGLYAQPFLTPLNLDVDFWSARAENLVSACIEENGDIFAHVATADVARDMDLLRQALGEEKLSYLGFSYGTFLGATYAALFPQGYRALVLDGAIDADQYINRPSANLRAQSAGFEVALDRFFQACAADQAACFGFGGADPYLAFDRLVEAANASPIPVPGSERPLDGDDVLSGAIVAAYSKSNWSFLAQSLAGVQNGDPTLMRILGDALYGGPAEDGSFDPITDRYFTLTAAEQNYAPDIDVFLANGYEAWQSYPRFFWNTGYTELPLGLFPIRATGTFRGPFVASPDAPTVLVVGTTYDPATPYRGSQLLVEQLGNARLLTMLGDGHTAYGGNTPCIDDAVNAYLLEGALPEVGTECLQDVPFEAPVAEAAVAGGAQRAPRASTSPFAFPYALRDRGIIAGGPRD